MSHLTRKATFTNHMCTITLPAKYKMKDATGANSNLLINTPEGTWFEMPADKLVRDMSQLMTLRGVSQHTT